MYWRSAIKYQRFGIHDRLVSTGDTLGGAFVCDPKLADRNEVKGQVKLKFTNVSGRTGMSLSERIVD